MKKLTAILLAILFACTPLIGCKQNTPQGDPNGNETTQHGTTETDDYDHVETQQGFSIKGEKYPYQNNDVLILDVENTTDTHYTATFTVTFYNEAGDAIKTQEKTIEQFPAKYKQPCLFQSNLQFASYTCEISVEEYTGSDYLSTLSFEKESFDVQRHDTIREYGGPKYPSLYLQVPVSFGPLTILPENNFLSIRCDVVVFDNVYSKKVNYRNTDKRLSGSLDVELLYSTDPDWEWPEELKGRLSVIVAPVSFEIMAPYSEG